MSIIESVVAKIESNPKNVVSFLVTSESVSRVKVSTGTKILAPEESGASACWEFVETSGLRLCWANARPITVNAMIYRKIRLNDGKILSFRMQS